MQTCGLVSKWANQSVNISVSPSHWSQGTWVLPDRFVATPGGTHVLFKNQNTTNKCSHSLLSKRPEQYNAEIPTDNITCGRCI